MKKDLLRKVSKVYTVLSTSYIVYEFIKCRGLNREDDMHLIKNAIGVITGEDVNYDYDITIDNTNLNVSYNPYMQLLTNSMGCIIMIIGTDVFVDARFRNMSTSTQKALLAHEMGHCKLKHSPFPIIYQFDRAIHVIKGQVLNMELEADAYAASIVGVDAMIKALKELSTYSHDISKKEIYLRINHLRKEVM